MTKIIKVFLIILVNNLISNNYVFGNLHKKSPITPAFEQNVGQFPDSVKYQIKIPTGCIQFCRNKVIFTFYQIINQKGNDSIVAQINHNTFIKSQSWAMHFAQDLNAIPIGENQNKDNFRFFGNRDVIGKKISRFQTIRYPNAFNNTDVLFYLDAKNGMFKYDVILKPGAFLNQIKIEYQGLTDLSTDSNKQLNLITLFGSFKESKPIGYFTHNKTPIEIDYFINNDSVLFNSNAIKSDATLTDTLVIDPVLLTWSSYFYGTSKTSLPLGSPLLQDNVFGFEMDDDGFLYVAGTTNMNYPQATQYFDTAYSKDKYQQSDIFYCKLTPKGDSIIFFNFIGGSKSDIGNSLDINNKGEALILGYASNDFPTSKGAYNNYSGGLVLFGFNAVGDSISFSTFISNNLNGQKAMFSKKNEILLIGIANGKSNIPITSNAIQPIYGGGYTDSYLAKLSIDGKNLLYSTFWGGSNDDFINDILINDDNEIYIVGNTRSFDFPVFSNNKDFTTLHGGIDGYVTKFDSSLTKVEFSNLIGGSSNDIFESIALNDQNQIYISGISASIDFPLSIFPKAFQQKNNGKSDLVIVRLFADGKNIKNSTYLGGSSFESATYSTRNASQIGLNAKGEVWVVVTSVSADFPITNDALQKKNDTLGVLKTDITLSKLNPDLDQLLYSSYFGGKYGELMETNSIKRKGCVTHILLGGRTFSNDFPTTKDGLMPNPPKDTLYGSIYYIDTYQKGFISRFSDTLSIEKTNFETSKLRCNQFLEILDGANKGARHRWSTQDSGQYLFVTQPGTYWLEATYGCDTLRDTITIIQQFGPKTVLPLDTFICDKKAIVLDALNDTIAATYLWSTTETTQKITVTKSGTYWVKITTANCGDITDTIHVHYITPPVLHLPKDTSICNQDSTLLIVGQNNFEKTIWQDTIQTSRFVVRQAGLFKVKTSNICGVDSASIQVNFAKSPKPFKIFRDTTICEGAEFVLKTGTPNNQETYLWENTTTQKTVSVADTFYVNQSGKFVVYNSNICGSSADSFSVTYLQLPKITLDSIYNPCQGSALPLSVGQPNNQEKYLWSNNATTATTSYNQSGNHWVQVSNNCGTAFQYFKIDFATKPKAAFNNSDVCEGQAFMLNNQSTQATGISYNWRLGDGTLDSGFAPVHTYKKTGNARTFLVSLLVASSKDCADSITLPINVNITPDASFDAAAQNKTVFFTPKNIDNQNTYKWYFGDGDSSNTKQPNHTYKADSGTYTVCLTLTNNSNCSSTFCQASTF